MAVCMYVCVYVSVQSAFMYYGVRTRAILRPITAIAFVVAVVVVGIIAFVWAHTTNTAAVVTMQSERLMNVNVNEMIR